MATKAEPLPGPYPKAYERFPTLRQSTLATFDACGLSSKFESDYRKGWSTHPQARGTIFHRTAGACLRTMHQHNEPQIPTDAALAHLHQQLRQEEVDRVCPACGGRKIRPGVKDGMRTCDLCRHRFETELMNLPMSQVKDLRWVTIKWANDNVWDIGNLVSVEERLAAPLQYSDPAGGFVTRTVTGQLDAVFTEGDRDDHAIVLDWKDTWGLPAPKEISDDGYFQQRIYGWLLMRNYPALQRVTLREFYVRFSEPREAELWRDQLDDVEQEFAALVERFDRAVNDNAFTPTPGKHCGWCMRPGACPILPEVRAEGRIRTGTQAEQMARQLVVASAAREQASKALMAWSDVHGPIPIRDAKGKRALGYVETTRTERPTREKLEEAVRLAAFRGEDVDVDALFATKKSTRFQQFVPKPERPTDEEAVLQASLEGALAEARANNERRSS